MIRPISAMRGYAIAASDGPIGSIADFLFDDATWLVRWIVIETGSWLAGRKVLLPPSVLGHVNDAERELFVRLTRQQVMDSPAIETDEPVSRAMEANLYGYYGWSPYWSTSLYAGGYGFTGGPAMLGYMEEALKRDERGAAQKSPHLRSARVVTGYHINASDGEIGHVADFLFEDMDWSIHYLIVDTSNWWLGTRVLVSPLSISKIEWLEREVGLLLKRDDVRSAPPYDADAVVDRAYEQELHRHYGTIALSGPA